MGRGSFEDIQAPRESTVSDEQFPVSRVSMEAQGAARPEKYSHFAGTGAFEASLSRQLTAPSSSQQVARISRCVLFDICQ